MPAKQRTPSPEDALHNAHIRVTRPRVAVLRALLRAHEPLSSETLIRKLRRTVDRATVYRTVKLLKQHGVVKQVDFQHGHAHFEAIHHPHHHHIVCVYCGDIEAIRPERHTSLDQEAQRLSKKFTRVTDHALEFFGSCRQCNTQRRARAPRSVR